MRFATHAIFFVCTCLLLLALPAEAQPPRSLLGLRGNVENVVDTFFRPGQMFVQNMVFKQDGTLKSYWATAWKISNGDYSQKTRSLTFVMKSFKQYQDSLVVFSTNGDRISFCREDDRLLMTLVRAFNVAKEIQRVRSEAKKMTTEQWNNVWGSTNNKQQYVDECLARISPSKIMYLDSWPQDLRELVARRRSSQVVLRTINVETMSPICGNTNAVSGIDCVIDRCGNILRLNAWDGRVVFVRNVSYY